MHICGTNPGEKTILGCCELGGRTTQQRNVNPSQAELKGLSCSTSSFMRIGDKGKKRHCKKLDPVGEPEGFLLVTG
jgi:hypothetical protein